MAFIYTTIEFTRELKLWASLPVYPLMLVMLGVAIALDALVSLVARVAQLYFCVVPSDQEPAVPGIGSGLGTAT